MRKLCAMIWAIGPLLAAGCTNTAPEPDLSAILGPPGTQVAVEFEPQVFDFGMVLARDQTLRHEFRLANSGDQPLHILGAKTYVSCCSHLGELPTVVPPGGSVSIVAFLQVGHIADLKRVTFDIITDAPARPIRTLNLLAQFVPAWEIQEVGPLPTVRLGQASSRTYRLIGRRKSGEGRQAPAEVMVSSPLEVEALTVAAEVEDSSGVIESTRTVTVRLPIRSQLGPIRESFTLRWPDGLVQSQDVRWTVEPKIRLAPATVMLPADAAITEVRVTARSEDRPFRIVRVAGGLLVGDGPTMPAALTHTLRLRLDASRLASGINPEIEVVTDDPDQPNLKIGVLVIPQAKGE